MSGKPAKAQKGGKKGNVRKRARVGSARARAGAMKKGHAKGGVARAVLLERRDGESGEEVRNVETERKWPLIGVTGLGGGGSARSVAPPPLPVPIATFHV